MNFKEGVKVDRNKFSKFLGFLVSEFEFYEYLL